MCRLCQGLRKASKHFIYLKMLFHFFPKCGKASPNRENGAYWKPSNQKMTLDVFVTSVKRLLLNSIHLWVRITYQPEPREVQYFSKPDLLYEFCRHLSDQKCPCWDIFEIVQQNNSDKLMKCSYNSLAFLENILSQELYHPSHPSLLCFCSTRKHDSPTVLSLFIQPRNICVGIPFGNSQITS